MDMNQKSVNKHGDLRVVLSLFLLACTLWIVKMFWERRHFYRKAATIPTSKTGPFGFVGDIFGKSIEESFHHVLKCIDTNPEVFKVWFGPRLLVGISKPEHIEVILTHPKSIGKSVLMEFTKAFMGNGLFSARPEIWKKNRKLINPTFNPKILHSFIPIFAEKCDILMDVLKEVVGQPDIDLRDIMQRCTVDSVCEAAMGVRVDAQVNKNHFGKLLDQAMEISMIRIFNIFIHPQLLFDISKIGRLFKRVVTEMNIFTRSVIMQKRAIFEQQSQETHIAEDEHGRMKTFLELLLEISQNGHEFSNQQLQDEVNTLMAAGSDTTSASLGFCCLTLAMHPEYQEKMYEEAIEVLGADMYPTRENISKLKFTDMFIKETLRVFPIAPLLTRICDDDIKIDEYIIPKDSIVVMGVMHLHQNPKYWEDPLKFNPYRFTPEEWAKKHKYSFLPFSAGPRNCIGHQYAMILMKVILTKMVRKFKLKTVYKNELEVPLKINLLMRPTDGFKVSFQVRE